jgi:hypothetical protein
MKEVRHITYRDLYIKKDYLMYAMITLGFAVGCAFLLAALIYLVKLVILLLTTFFISWN